MLDRKASPVRIGGIGGGLLVAPVLASASPQRTAILAQLGIPHRVQPADVEERMEGDPAQVAEANARAKAQAVAPQHRTTAVIGCDTIVVTDAGEILGKPAGRDAARTMLTRLTGATHTVISGLAIAGPGHGLRSGVAQTRVTMRELTPEALDRHLAHGEWEGRAGGYAIQGRGASLVQRIEGDYFNVVGLPVALLAELAPDLVDRAPRKRSSAAERGEG